eukprot:69494_1
MADSCSRGPWESLKFHRKSALLNIWVHNGRESEPVGRDIRVSNTDLLDVAQDTTNSLEELGSGHSETSLGLPERLVENQKSLSEGRLRPPRKRVKLVADQKLYCICKKSYDHQSGEDMIECASCSDWFHPECVGISEDIVLFSSDDRTYTCKVCAEK